MAPSSDNTGTAAGPQGRFNPWNWGRNVKSCGKWLQPASKRLRARSEGLWKWETKLWRSFQPRLCNGGWTDARKGRQAGRQAGRPKGGLLLSWSYSIGPLVLGSYVVCCNHCLRPSSWHVNNGGGCIILRGSDVAVLMITDNAEFWGLRVWIS